MSNILPINLARQQIGLIIEGACTVLHRPQGRRFAELQAGDRLWVREPFCLPGHADRFAPSMAASLDLPFAFPDQVAPGVDPWGGIRPARTLPRAAHRQHLLVTDVRLVPVDQIPPAELTAQGYASARDLLSSIALALAGFASFYAAARRPSADNPVLQAIRFTRVAHPVPPKEKIDG